MAHGKVIWFNAEKGYGFVEDSKGEKFFAHFSEIQSDLPIKKLLPDQKVKFEVDTSNKDLATRPAKNIEIQS